MALTPNFAASQPIGDNEAITLEDTSSGSDGTIAARRVYFLTAGGEYLVSEGNDEDYETWALADAEETFNVLDKDYALSVRVDWVNSGGTVLYTKTLYYGFTQYNEEFDYGLTQKIAVNPYLINEWLQKKSDLRTYIDSGNQAVELASDIANAQICYDKATDIRLNQSYIF